MAEADEPGDDKNNGLTFAESVLKRRRMETLCNSDTYIDITYLTPTSNVSERLFSKAGYLLNEKGGLLPCECRGTIIFTYKSRFMERQRRT